ncbi:MAG: CBS domain-containing protein [Thermoplasmatales archaeon]|nr:CBS domain-containing protein [Thermoplasmatales archaeon]MCW6170742.1 CBS domain-containing protein [Thermoplasmatales archaeon]
MKVEKLVDRNFKTISEKATIFDAVSEMNKNNLYGLLVVDDLNKYVGLLSERSIIRRFILRNLRPDQVTVKAVMRKPLPRVSSEDDIKDVAAYLSENGLSRCAVFDKNEKLLGVVTVTDLSRYLSSETLHDVLFSHKTKEYEHICPKCKTGVLRPVYNSKGEITVFQCDNPACNYVE